MQRGFCQWKGNTVTVTKQQILLTLASIEKNSPLFFGAMPVADDRVREIFAESMAEMNASADFRRASVHSRETSLLAMLTHVLLEAACLRHQLSAPGQCAETETRRLLKRVAILRS